MKHLLGILFLFACLLTLSAGGAVAQGLPIRRSPFPVNKSSLKRVKGLEAVPIPDNIEAILAEQEYWQVCASNGAYVTGGEVYFDGIVYFDDDGDDSNNYDVTLQFHPACSEYTIHKRLPSRKDIHYTTRYADTLTVIAYDGKNVVITGEQLKDGDPLVDFIYEKDGKKYDEPIGYEMRNRMDEELFAVTIYILRPLTIGARNRIFHLAPRSIFEQDEYPKNILHRIVKPIAPCPIGKAELVAVKKRKIKKIVTQ
ncbi:MAG: hypothetical protein E7138_09235 [Rikenellaceae bacterium]|nr:hypothetical protein [Rikenellaceae bacterium]